MPRNIKSGLIQMSLPMTEGEGSIAEIKEAMLQKHIPFILNYFVDKFTLEIFLSVFIFVSIGDFILDDTWLVIIISNFNE